MSRNVVLGLVVLLAIVGIAWLLGGLDAIVGTDRGAGAGGGDEERPGAATAGSGDATGEDAGASGAPKGTSLDSRRPERRGVGALVARVEDPKKAPIAGAKLRLTGVGYGGEKVELEATSDEKGAIALAAVPAGIGYVVRVDVEGKPSVSIPDLEVRAGRTKDLGPIQIGLRSSVVGKVVDETGAAVEGADVRAFATHDNMMDLLGNMMELITTLGREPTPIGKATSDADGQFRIADLPSGSVLLRATVAKKRPGFARIRVTEQGPTGGTPTLRVEPGALIGGVVVEGGTNAPVAGATVALMSQGMSGEDGDELGDAFDFFSRRQFATTDAKGAWTAVVREGVSDLRAIVEAAGYPTTMTAAIKPGDLAVKIVLVRGAILELTIVDAATSKPISGVQVFAMVGEDSGQGPGEGGGGMLTGATDERGVVSLPSGPGLVQMVMTSHPSYAAVMAYPANQEAMDAMTGGGLAKAGAGVSVPKEVKVGEPTRGTIRLQGGIKLTGRVTDRAGTPILGAEVMTLSFMGGGNSGATVKTDADGMYVLAGVSSMMGQPMAFISFRAPGFVTKSETLQLTEALIAAGEARQDTKLARSATLRGKVVDVDGKPIAGARVRRTGGGEGFDFAAMMGGGAPVLTDAEGAYVILDAPPSGETPAEAEPKEGQFVMPGMGNVRVSADAEGYVGGSTDELKIREGETVDVPPLRLTKGVVAKGVVRQPGGRAAAGARVEARLEPVVDPGDVAGMVRRGMASALSPKSVRTDGEGRYEFTGLAPGTLSVVARADGFAATRRQTKVAAEPVEVDVTLRPAGSLAGQVHGADGKPLSGARISVGEAEAGLVGVTGEDAWVESATVQSGPDGRFTLTGLPAGTVNVTVRAEKHKNATLAGVTGGAPLDVRLEARPAARPREVVTKEFQEVVARLGAATTDEEKTALRARMNDLMKEMQGDGPETPEVPEVVVQEEEK